MLEVIPVAQIASNHPAGQQYVWNAGKMAFRCVKCHIGSGLLCELEYQCNIKISAVRWPPLRLDSRCIWRCSAYDGHARNIESTEPHAIGSFSVCVSAISRSRGCKTHVAFEIASAGDSHSHWQRYLCDNLICSDEWARFLSRRKSLSSILWTYLRSHWQRIISFVAVERETERRDENSVFIFWNKMRKMHAIKLQMKFHHPVELSMFHFVN